MEEISLSVSPRGRSGSGSSGRIRREGRIPAVVYGVGGTRNLSVDRSAFLKVWRAAGQSSVVTISDGAGFSSMTLVQDVQRDPLTDEFLHIDFLELTKGHAITANIPVHTRGEAVGVRTGGGVLDIHLHEVEIRCLPNNLPHQIDVDVENLDVGEAVHIKDLPAIPGVEYMGDGEQPVVAVVHGSVGSEETDGEAQAGEVEVITGKKEEAREENSSSKE
ncbi:MAG: 50S ribosomal protein L25 [Puniceicoccaceae bacterium]